MEPIIRCENVTLGYGREIILENISLKIPRGIFMPFTGPNGAGKTTLLRGILGLLKPMKGIIHTPFSRKPAGYVPQHKSIDPLFPLTVRGIIKMGLYPELGWWKTPTPDQKKKMDAVIEELKLTEHAYKNYRDLSGGTKQKTLIARALVSGAEVFIMDEPTSELDEETAKEVSNHLHRFVQKEGKTVLVVHHGLHHPDAQMTSQSCEVNHGKIKIIQTVGFLPSGNLP